MKYAEALRQAEKTGKLQEECEDIADYMMRYDLTVSEAISELINDGVFSKSH